MWYWTEDQHPIYVAASQVSFFTSLIDELQYEQVFSAMHTKLNLKIIKYKNFAVIATLKSAYFLYKRTEHNQEQESIHLQVEK